MDTERFPVEQQREQTDLTLPVEAQVEQPDLVLPVELQAEQPGPTLPKVTVVVEGLSKSFRSGGEVIRAVDEVSFAFTEGQFVAILGPSGCGKSTLLYLLGGLDKPGSGELNVDGV